MKYFKIVFLASIFPLLLLLDACGIYYHYPTQQDVMRFKEKGDAYLSWSPVDIEGFSSYSAGYAITEHVAAVSSFKTFGGAIGNLDDYMWDNEMALFTQIQNRFYPSVNVGYGFGQINRRDSEYRLGLNRQSILPAFSFSNKFFDFAISARFSRASYQLNITAPLSPEDELYFDFRDIGKRDFYFVEPAVTVGVGSKWVKLRGQYVVSQKLSDSAISYYTDPNLILSLNVTLNMIDLFGGRNEKVK